MVWAENIISIVPALLVIGQNFDHAAFGDLAVPSVTRVTSA